MCNFKIQNCWPRQQGQHRRSKFNCQVNWEQCLDRSDCESNISNNIFLTFCVQLLIRSLMCRFSRQRAIFSSQGTSSTIYSHYVRKIRYENTFKCQMMMMMTRNSKTWYFGTNRQVTITKLYSQNKNGLSKK